MHTFTIPTGHFRAALLCAAKKDLRTYLNGVYLDGPQGTIVGTDGHRMFVCRAALPACVSVIIGREHLEKALKISKKSESIIVTVIDTKKSDGAPSVMVTLESNGAAIVERAVEGTYPDYSRVIPSAVNGEPAVYNPAYLADATEALRLAAGLKKLDSARMGYNGTGAGVMHLGADPAAIVVLMPLRDMVDNVFPHVLRPAADATADATADAAADASTV